MRYILLILIPFMLFSQSDKVFKYDVSTNIGILDTLWEGYIKVNDDYFILDTNQFTLANDTLSLNVSGTLPNGGFGRILLHDSTDWYVSNSFILDTISDNIYIGERAGNNASGDYNVFIGRFAGNNNTDNNHVSIGEYAGYNATGISMVNIGYEAGFIYSGNYAVNIGYKAGNRASNIEGISIGNQSGRNVYGDKNIYFGESAGYNDTSDYNIGIGTRALYKPNGTGNNRTIGIGYWSGYQFEGIYNTYIGNFSGQNSTGDYNTFIGSNSGLYSIGAYNTAIGRNSGYSSTGSNNIYLGEYAGHNNNGDYRLYINSGGIADSTEPLIYGEFDNDVLKVFGDLFLSRQKDTAEQILYLDTTGKVSTKNYDTALRGDIKVTYLKNTVEIHQDSGLVYTGMRVYNFSSPMVIRYNLHVNDAPVGSDSVAFYDHNGNHVDSFFVSSPYVAEVPSGFSNTILVTRTYVIYDSDAEYIDYYMSSSQTYSIRKYATYFEAIRED